MIIAHLLHYANSDPPFDRRAFYALKDRLLRKYAKPDGYDTQEIIKECYGEDWDKGCPVRRGTGKRCLRCGNTGIWDRRIISLERFVWHGRRFHIPLPGPALHNPLITIRGYVDHKNYGRLSDEAAIWLFLLCGEFRLAWREMTISYRYGWYAWPLLTVGRLLSPLRRFKPRRCNCGRPYLPSINGKSYACYCSRCIAAMTRRSEGFSSEVPF